MFYSFITISRGIIFNRKITYSISESTDVNHDIEFDFLVCSQFLRASLAEHIAERNISTEDVIIVEYVEKYPPPEPQDCLIHDDWVSAVAACEKWLHFIPYNFIASSFKIAKQFAKDTIYSTGY